MEMEQLPGDSRTEKAPSMLYSRLDIGTIGPEICKQTGA